MNVSVQVHIRGGWKTAITFPKCMRVFRASEASTGTGELAIARKPREGIICILHKCVVAQERLLVWRPVHLRPHLPDTGD